MRIGDGTSLNFRIKSFDGGPLSQAAAETDGFASLLYPKDDAGSRSVTATSSSRVTWGTQDGGTAAANDAVTKDFLDWMKKDPIEKLRAQILESMGLDEEGLAALPPEEREAVEAQLREAIMRALGVGEEGIAAAADGTGKEPDQAAAP